MWLDVALLGQEADGSAYDAYCGGLAGACHNSFSACETERRPRGASRINPLLQFVSGQFLL